MSSDLLTRAIRETEAALRGIAESLGEVGVRHELVLTPLARVGDALRLSVEVPAPVRQWLTSLSDDNLRGATRALATEAGAWHVPESDLVDEADPLLAGVLRSRDEAESVRVALRRIVVASPTRAVAREALGELEDVLQAADETMAPRVSRDEVSRLLGARAALGASWADGFRESEPLASGDASPVTFANATPTDEMVTRYATRGAFARAIEGTAAASPQFAKELAECIDGLVQAGESVGLVARGWLKRAGQGISNPLRLAVLPPQRLAAATSPTTRPRTVEVRLGALAPLDAEGRLEVSAREVLLEVYEGSAPLREVALAGALATASAEPGVWRLTAPVPTGGRVPIRIVGHDGASFVEELILVPLDEHEAD